LKRLLIKKSKVNLKSYSKVEKQQSFQNEKLMSNFYSSIQDINSRKSNIKGINLTQENLRRSLSPIGFKYIFMDLTDPLKEFRQVHARISIIEKKKRKY